jgi:hypothetical protein
MGTIVVGLDGRVARERLSGSPSRKRGFGTRLVGS